MLVTKSQLRATKKTKGKVWELTKSKNYNDMRKTVLTMMMMGVMLFCFAQEHIPFGQYYVAPEFTEEFGASKVEDLRANQPAELVRMHYTMFNYALVIGKLWDGNFQQMGMLEQYLPKGMAYNEDELIKKGYVNPFKWNLPQDTYRYNLFKLRNSEYYVVVMPKVTWEERLNAHLHQYGF